MRDNLHELLAAAVARSPDAVAVSGGSSAVTYAQLDERIDALATAFRRAGLGRGDRVVVWSPKSPDTIAAMQAALRLGAVYVPVDPLTPAGRVSTILRAAGAQVLCVPSDLFAQVEASFPPGIACVDPAAPSSPEVPAAADLAGPDDPAFILFTSGSTGTPKGVCISHRNALSFVEWAVAELAPGPEDRFANHASFSFDLSVLDIYAAFTAGAAVCLVPAEYAYAPRRLVEFLHRERITVWYSVPSVLMLMQAEGGLLDAPPPPSLRALLFAGEPFPIPFVRQLASWTAVRLLNLYGPTETNVCTFHEVGPEDLRRDSPVPIGRPCSGDDVWARGPDGSPVAPGDEGELIVAGPTVFLGYWGEAPQVGPFATGDRVRVRADGSFDYLGRDDGMVKVRGHRIELGEVAAALHSHRDIADACVVGAGDGLDRQLVAFVVRAPGQTCGTIAIRRHLAQHLPPQMIPQVIRFVAELPRTARGKLDTTTLQARANEREHQ